MISREAGRAYKRYHHQGRRISGPAMRVPKRIAGWLGKWTGGHPVDVCAVGNAITRKFFAETLEWSLSGRSHAAGYCVQLGHGATSWSGDGPDFMAALYAAILAYLDWKDRRGVR